MIRCLQLEHLAFQQHQLDITRLLLDHTDININIRVKCSISSLYESLSALDIATTENQVNIIFLLLEQPNINLFADFENEYDYEDTKHHLF
jgi:ankyrin repeat protein